MANLFARTTLCTARSVMLSAEHKAVHHAHKAPRVLMQHFIDFLVVTDVAHAFAGFHAPAAALIGVVVVLVHHAVNS